MNRTGLIQRKTPLRAKAPMARKRERKQPAERRRERAESRFRSERYLRFVRSLPCCCCGAPADSAHHVIGIWQVGGMGLKAPDSLAMPVCDGPGGCHSRIHDTPGLQRMQPRWLVDTINRGLDEFTTEPIVGELCRALEFIVEREG